MLASGTGSYQAEGPALGEQVLLLLVMQQQQSQQVSIWACSMQPAAAANAVL
jgi:hypothetical protein